MCISCFNSLPSLPLIKKPVKKGKKRLVNMSYRRAAKQRRKRNKRFDNLKKILKFKNKTRYDIAKGV